MVAIGGQHGFAGRLPTFYADDRRINVAISRARDAVYLVGDIDYIRSKRLPVLDALAKLDVLILHPKEDV